MNNQSHLHDPELTVLLFAVLVKRLGGKVLITQSDIDKVAYNRLEEKGHEDGSLEFKFFEKQRLT